ncbi:RNA pyrophosphohydrolase [Leptospira perolatii]|uniref:RNA pyrophosphohydrolase n=1 Tax=Leptospira perolatii TaxID=2023191 RepID=A0A2M9ZSC7_9LEPT|nr:RNA pyrophosphohydrolase [Leptospira perolatii]PJZ71345.1 RNA pyrophosphohydrolase [Leptospira perolatii]PJZ74879.1 RNA pyrophosphohydrolase [Leptospira perolatii]
MSKPYRKNVGMVVFNSKGEVLVGARMSFPGSWQFPQGGIDDNEDPSQAALRELYEEVGIQEVKIVSEYPGWISYDFPENLQLNKHLQKYKGQMQRWFLIYWDGKEEDTNLEIHEREFEQVKFVPLSECLKTVVSFKRDVYEKVVSEFSPTIQKYLEKPNQ